jgi:hypothetical protein
MSVIICDLVTHWPNGSIEHPAFSQALTTAFHSLDSCRTLTVRSSEKRAAAERGPASEVAGAPRKAHRAKTTISRRRMELDMTFSLLEATGTGLYGRPVASFRNMVREREGKNTYNANFFAKGV